MALYEPYRAGTAGTPKIGISVSGYRDGRVNTPGPGRATNSNQKLAATIHGGLMAYDFDAGHVAGWLLGMPEALQKRLAALVFHLVQSWANMANVTDQYGPNHPMFEENRLARQMIHGVVTGD